VDLSHLLWRVVNPISEDAAMPCLQGDAIKQFIDLMNAVSDSCCPSLAELYLNFFVMIFPTVKSRLTMTKLFVVELIASSLESFKLAI
jgi:hypothetical protein